MHINKDGDLSRFEFEQREGESFDEALRRRGREFSRGPRFPESKNAASTRQIPFRHMDTQIPRLTDNSEELRLQRMQDDLKFTLTPTTHQEVVDNAAYVLIHGDGLTDPLPDDFEIDWTIHNNWMHSNWRRDDAGHMWFAPEPNPEALKAMEGEDIDWTDPYAVADRFNIPHSAIDGVLNPFGFGVGTVSPEEEEQEKQERARKRRERQSGKKRTKIQRSATAGKW